MPDAYGISARELAGDLGYDEQINRGDLAIPPEQAGENFL